MSQNIVTATVRHCARCGTDHQMEFREFTRPNVDADGTEWTHWGMCPVTDEPVLMRHDSEDGSDETG